MPNSNDFNHFAVNPTDINIQRSIFNMDHSVKFSCNVGEVIPFEVMECLPGDTWSVDTSKVVRLQPLVAPIMDEVILDVYYFFVPNRLVWNHWKEFCGENNSSPWAPMTTYKVPQIFPPVYDQQTQLGGWDVGTIADYMGIPPRVCGSYVSALPFRAYALICNDWFRSESVMNPVHIYTDDISRSGNNSSDQVTGPERGGKPFIACKFFDYFTSCLPDPQRGAPANVFPNDKFAPVVTLDSTFMSSNGLIHPFDSSNPTNDYGSGKKYNTLGMNYVPAGGGNYHPFGQQFTLVGGSEGLSTSKTTVTEANIDTHRLALNNIFANLSLASMTINDLRSAFAVQRYLEKSARYGGRYIEFIKGFFGVDSPDARLQRSEYLGGSRLSLNINSVEQTSATQNGTTPLGNVAGMSVTGDINSDFTYSCTEHGYIIGCSVLRYHHTYQQGINRMWLRENFEEFYLPTFAFLGEAPVYEEEIYYYDNYPNTAPEKKSEVFGYQERWAEYRYMPSRVAGQMRTISNTSLDVWHLGDWYTTKPTLTPDWIREDKSMLDRCLAVTSAVADQCICDFYLKCKVARALPLYSIPGLVDHY